MNLFTSIKYDVKLGMGSVTTKSFCGKSEDYEKSNIKQQQQQQQQDEFFLEIFYF
jgi:hypothetical protein